VLGNAIKFTAPDGQIEVQLGHDEHSVAIEVSDDGQGFDPLRAGELLEPFAQQDTSLARTTPGLGLGLPIARAIVELHGGHIVANSPGPEHGATFRIELPAAKPPASEQTVSQPDHGRGRSDPTPARWRVLLIEDNDDIAATYKVLLHQLGHHAELVRTETAGVETAQLNPPGHRAVRSRLTRHRRLRGRAPFAER
jgi:two-component system, chemotaxis family, CheB/CheR fusion protein